MTTISSVRHCFACDQPARHAFTLGFRKVEDLAAERGGMSLLRDGATMRLTFGPSFARELGCGRDRPTFQWHLDERAVTIASRQFWLWRPADDEGEVLDLVFQRCGKTDWCEGAVTRTQIGRASQSGGPSSGLDVQSRRFLERADCESLRL
jgi:hypothetical protein